MKSMLSTLLRVARLVLPVFLSCTRTIHAVYWLWKGERSSALVVGNGE